MGVEFNILELTTLQLNFIVTDELRNGTQLWLKNI